MKWIASVLLLGVLFRHNMHFLLSTSTGLTPQIWFYILGGAWEVILCAILLMLVHGSREPWRYLAMAALTIGILEGLQISVCQLAVGNLWIPEGGDICDYVTRLPVAATMLALYVFILSLAIGRTWFRMFEPTKNELTLGFLLMAVYTISGAQMAHFVGRVPASLVIALGSFLVLFGHGKRK